MIDEKYLEVPPFAEVDAIRRRRLPWMKAYIVSSVIGTPLFIYAASTDSFLLVPLALVFGAATLVFFLVVGVSLPVMAKKAWEDFERIDFLIDKGDLVRARSLCEEKLKLGPKNVDWLAYYLIRYAIIEFFEGDCDAGLRLAMKAKESGWLDEYHLAEAENWIVMMLFHSGDIEKTMVVLEASTHGFYSQFIINGHFENWEQILELVDSHELEEFSAVMGHYAATQLGLPTSRFDHKAANLPGRVRLNPVLQPYLPERRVLLS